MAPPRAVARELRKSAAKIGKICDPVVADTAAFAVEQSTAAGTFAGRRLLVVVRSSSNARGRSSATVAGKTAGGWSIKSYGRRGGYTVRPRRRRALTVAGNVRTIARPGPTSGDDSWNRLVVEPVTDMFVEIAETAVTKALKG